MLDTADFEAAANEDADLPGFTEHMGVACLTRHELGWITTDLESCHSTCHAMHSCNAFMFRAADSTCAMSSTCTATHATEASSWSTFVRDQLSYTPIEGSACLDRYELGVTQEGSGVQACAALCDADSTCVSFALRGSDNQCQRSSSCTADLLTGGVGGLATNGRPGFTRVIAYAPNGASCTGRNELGTYTSTSVEDCAH